MSRIFFLPHFYENICLAKIFYYPQYILLFKLISPPVSFFYDDSFILQRIFPLLSIILRVTYYLFCDDSAEYNFRMFLSTDFVCLSAYFSNNGLPHTLSLQSSFRSVYTNFLPIFCLSPYKLIVYPDITLISVSFFLSS